MNQKPKSPAKKKPGYSSEDFMKDLILGKDTPKEIIKKGLMGFLNNL